MRIFIRENNIILEYTAIILVFLEIFCLKAKHFIYIIDGKSELREGCMVENLPYKQQ